MGALNFLLDQRSSVDNGVILKSPKISLNLIWYIIAAKMTIDKIIELPDVKERSDVYFKYEEKYKQQLEKYATIHDNIVVLDLRQEETRYPGNRFLIYALLSPVQCFRF